MVLLQISVNSSIVYFYFDLLDPTYSIVCPVTDLIFFNLSFTSGVSPRSFVRMTVLVIENKYVKCTVTYVKRKTRLIVIFLLLEDLT